MPCEPCQEPASVLAGRAREAGRPDGCGAMKSPFQIVDYSGFAFSTYTICDEVVLHEYAHAGAEDAVIANPRHASLV